MLLICASVELVMLLYSPVSVLASTVRLTDVSALRADDVSGMVADKL